MWMRLILKTTRPVPSYSQAVNNFLKLPLDFLAFMRYIIHMLKMKLNKEEQEFIAENITKFDVVTGIEVNDIEVRIHGKHFGGVGSAAIYRTNDMAKIWKHSTNKIKKIEKNLKKVLG